MLICPVVETMYDYETTLIRLGHFLGSPRNITSFLTQVEAHLEQIFEYKVVRTLPAECAAWRHDSEWILKASLASMDLTDADIADSVSHDNGDGRGHKYVHYQVIGNCSVNAQGLNIVCRSPS